jgi:hypothetical protein
MKSKVEQAIVRKGAAKKAIAVQVGGNIRRPDNQ